MIMDVNPMDDDPLAFRAVLATDLLAFLERAFREIDPRGALHVADYVLYLSDVLQHVADGKDSRVILSLPPRHLKSILASIVWPAWLLGQDPKLRIAVISHSQAFARDLSLKALRLMESDFYRDVFPQTRLRDDRRQAIDFETSQSGGRYAASFETGITGRGFDLIIVDDPISAHAVRSSAERDRVNETFDTMVASRLDDPLRGAIVVVGQRLHENDLSGYLLAKGGWKHVCLPLIAEETTTLQIGSRLWVRNKGDVLLPALWPPHIIRQRRAEVGEAIFSAQYQQNPSAAIGELIKPEHVRKFDELPPSANRCILSWDTAVKTGPNASFTVCLVLATDGKRHYVVDVLRARLDPVQARDAALRLIVQYSPRTILIEDASSGPGLAKMLEEHHHRCELWPTAGMSKEERLEPHLHMFSAGRVLIKNNEPWTTDLANEWLRFPFGRHDDQVDAMTQYLNWVAEKLPATKSILTGVGGWEDNLARTLNHQTRPIRKGEHPLRPRRGGFRVR
jgi:predicted phage terminase large subunit-like protein